MVVILTLNFNENVPRLKGVIIGYTFLRNRVYLQRLSFWYTWWRFTKFRIESFMQSRINFCRKIISFPHVSSKSNCTIDATIKQTVITSATAADRPLCTFTVALIYSPLHFFQNFLTMQNGKKAFDSFQPINSAHDWGTICLFWGSHEPPNRYILPQVWAYLIGWRQ